MFSVIVTDKERTLGVGFDYRTDRITIEALLEYCNRKGGSVGFGEDTSHAVVEVTKVVSNYLNSSMGVGIISEPTSEWAIDGMYIVDGWDIVDRVKWDWKKDKEIPYPTENEQRIAFMKALDEKQPIEKQINDIIDATLMPVSEVDIGDCIYTYCNGLGFLKHIVTDFSDREEVDGKKVYALPIIDDGDLDDICSYVTDEYVWATKKEKRNENI